MAYVHGRQPTTRWEGKEGGCGCHSDRACDGACKHGRRRDCRRRRSSPDPGPPEIEQPAPGPSTTGRASRRRERRRSLRAPALGAPSPVRSRSGSEVPGGLERSQGPWASGGPHQAWAGRGMQHRGSPSTMELPLRRRGASLGLRARAGRRGRRRWSVCEVAARGELSCRQTATSRGDPHTEGFAGPWEWIVGVAGSTPVYRRSPLFWGGRGVGSFRAGRRQPFAGLERAWGLILSRSCCTMYVPSTRAVSDRRHSTARGITNSRCRTAPIGRAGRAPRPGWVVVGEGTVQGWGVAFFAIWGCDLGDGRAGGLCRLFLRCGADHVGVFVGIVRNSGTIGYEFGNRCRGCFSGFGACRVRV